MTDTLREKAERATPGPWEPVSLSGYGGPHAIRMAYHSSNPKASITYYGVQSVGTRENADYIAAADPQTIIGLLDERDADKDTIDAQQKRIAALEVENAVLKQNVITFAVPHAVSYARDFGLPDGHLHPAHYDILEKCGARMVEFTRASIAAKEGRS